MDACWNHSFVTPALCPSLSPSSVLLWCFPLHRGCSHFGQPYNTRPQRAHVSPSVPHKFPPQNTTKNTTKSLSLLNRGAIPGGVGTAALGIDAKNTTPNTDHLSYLLPSLPLSIPLPAKEKRRSPIKRQRPTTHARPIPPPRPTASRLPLVTTMGYRQRTTHNCTASLPRSVHPVATDAAPPPQAGPAQEVKQSRRLSSRETTPDISHSTSQRTVESLTCGRRRIQS